MNSKPRRLICCTMSVKAFIWNWMPAVINAAFPCSNCGLFVLVMAEHWLWQKLSGSKEPSGENCSLSLTHCCGKKFAKNGHGAPLAADALFLAWLLPRVSCTLALFFFSFKFAPALRTLKTKGKSDDKVLKRCIIEEAPLLWKMYWCGWFRVGFCWNISKPRA